MARYFCVFRITDNGRGTTAEYDANDVVSAINKMVEIAHVSKEAATNGFHEYEIYEVIGPRTYVTVASKLPSNKRQNGPMPYPEDEKSDNKLATPASTPQPQVKRPAAPFTIGKL